MFRAWETQKENKHPALRQPLTYHSVVFPFRFLYAHTVLSFVLFFCVCLNASGVPGCPSDTGCWHLFSVRGDIHGPACLEENVCTCLGVCQQDKGVGRLRWVKGSEGLRLSSCCIRPQTGPVGTLTRSVCRYPCCAHSPTLCISF